MTNAIKSLSLACRVILDMHALNNEGNESNRLMTRQVGIFVRSEDEDKNPTYEKAVVNAISGDMNKHIFADAFRDVALDMKLPVCPACQALDPARMMAIAAFSKAVENEDNDEFFDTVQEGKKTVRRINPGRVIDRLLTCVVDDMCGIMITAGTSIKRKSAVEFGWTVGLPSASEVQEYIHARHAITRLTRAKAVEGDQTSRDQAIREKEENIGQMIFNRPASSGVYAFVAHLDVAAIGFNDATQKYPDFLTDRELRFRAALLALAQTVLHPKGALTSTQFPHVVGIEGYMSASTSAAAAPLVSPLVDDFQGRASRTADMLNKLHGDSVQVGTFEGGDGLLSATNYVLEQYAPGVYRRG